MYHMPVILSIGGNDPTGGAGLSMDTRVGHHFGVRVLPIVSCISAQDGNTVSRVDWVSPEQLEAQIDAIVRTIGRLPEIIKIGLFASHELIDTFANYYQQHTKGQSVEGKSLIIYDPVLANGVGCSFVHKRDQSLSDLVQCIGEKLLPLCSLLTPNHNELACLNGVDTACVYNQPSLLAERILSKLVAKPTLTSTPVLVLSGGHGEDSDEITNTYFVYNSHNNTRLMDSYPLTQKRLRGNYRGTGCALSSAIACHLSRWVQKNKQGIARSSKNNPLSVSTLSSIIRWSFDFVHHAVAYTYDYNCGHSASSTTVNLHQQILHFPTDASR